MNGLAIVALAIIGITFIILYSDIVVKFMEFIIEFTKEHWD